MRLGLQLTVGSTLFLDAQALKAKAAANSVMRTGLTADNPKDGREGMKNYPLQRSNAIE
jgi:hypothetical protein